MGSTGQAGIIRSHRDFDLIQQRLGQFLAVQITLRHLTNGFVHRLIVVGGGYDQIGLLDQAILVDTIMMKQGAAWRLNHTNTFSLHLTTQHPFFAENIRVEQQFLNRFGCMQQLDHARPVIGQGHVDRLAVT